MTLDDLINEFQITYDIGSLALAGFEDSEIKKLLEIAQYRLISQRLGGNNVYGSKFPETSKRIDDLNGIIISAVNGSGSSNITWSASTQPGMYIVIFPDNYLHLVEFAVGSIDSGWQYAKQVKLSEFNRFAQGRGNTLPYVRTPVYCFIGSDGGNRKMRVCMDIQYKEEIGVSSVSCLYIKKPTNLESSSLESDTELTDFNDDVYHEIVRMAVDDAIAIATPEKSQISQQQLNKSE